MVENSPSVPRWVWRTLTVLIGCGLVVVGCDLSWGRPAQTEGAPSSLLLTLRPAESGWRVLGAGEPEAAGDIGVDLSFQTRRTGGRKMPKVTELKAEVTPLPTATTAGGPGRRPAEFELRPHLGLLADETDRRLNRPVYAIAVRHPGEWLALDAARKWWGFGFFLAGMVMVLWVCPERWFKRKKSWFRWG